MTMILIFEIHKPGIFGSHQDIGGWSDLQVIFKNENEGLEYIQNEIKNPRALDIVCWQLVTLGKDPEVRYFTRKGEWVPHHPNKRKWRENYIPRGEIQNI